MATIQGKEITRVYMGKAGCMCGCRGKYSDKRAAIAKVVNRMKRFAFDPSARASVLGRMAETVGCCFSVDYETPGGTRRTLAAYYDK